MSGPKIHGLKLLHAQLVNLQRKDLQGELFASKLLANQESGMSTNGLEHWHVKEQHLATSHFMLHVIMISKQTVCSAWAPDNAKTVRADWYFELDARSKTAVMLLLVFPSCPLQLY